MQKFTQEIQLLTPIWTGDVSGMANGLKMSGLIGGLRHNFEMLVRKHGGHTCNITGQADQRCNYEESGTVCPACAVFGCTGLQRSFKVNLELDSVPVKTPLTDSRIKNRKHDNTEYTFSCMIAKWLILAAGIKKSVNDITDGQEAALLQQIKVAWKQDNAAELNFIVMHSFLTEQDINLENLLRYLLAFMAAYSGLGAKINQGWGLFQLQETDGNPKEIVQQGEEEMKKLIDSFSDIPQSFDANLPTASESFVATWPLSGNDLGFNWNRRVIPTQYPFLLTGFAMTYRLRRDIKFYERDTGKDLFGAQKWYKPWRSVARALPIIPWRDTLPFVRALFGRDTKKGEPDQVKCAGLVGVSHLFKINGNWHIRLTGRIPDRYCYRQWDQKKKRDTSVWLDWDASVVQGTLVTRMGELLEKENVWQKTDGVTWKQGGII